MRFAAGHLSDLFPDQGAGTPGVSGAARQLGAGALAGLAIAAPLGGASAAWLLAGALLGCCAVLLGAAASRRERAASQRVLAFALAAQAVLGLLPLAAYSGVLAPRPADDFRVLHLLLPSLSVVALTGLRHHRSRPRTDRRAGRRSARTDGLSIERWGRVLAMMLLSALLGGVDALVPAPYSTAFLYLLPVFVAVYAAEMWGGLVLALVCAEVHGIVRGLTFPGELSASMSILESLLTLGGLAAAALLARGLELVGRAARTDPLTRLTNRTAFLKRLDAELARSRGGREARPLSLAYLDLDGFKAVNDREGHTVGDQVLLTVAGVLQASVREREEHVARLGGDEFAVLLADTDADGARHVIERLRRQVEDRMRYSGWQVTCSVGVVTSERGDATADAMIRRADELMYQAKHGGKNALQQAVLAAR